MENIIEFAYTGSIMWSKVHDLVSIVRDTDFLGLDDVRDQGIKFLTSSLNSQNALDAYHLSNICGSILLKNKSQELILQNFDIVSRSEECLKLDAASIKDILSTNPRIHCTKKILEGTLRWILEDLETRKSHLDDVLGLVDFSLFNGDKLIEITTNENILTTSKEHK